MYNTAYSTQLLQTTKNLYNLSQMQGTKKLPTTSEYFVFISFLNWIEVDPKRKQLRGKLLLFDQCKFNMVITMPKKTRTPLKCKWTVIGR